ncbi:MAG: hypothetical protein WKF58_00545 [Ilumatobacteraceae bacterium]
MRRNHELMILRRDAPIDVDLDTLAVSPDPQEVKRLFDFLEFRTLGDRLGRGARGQRGDHRRRRSPAARTRGARQSRPGRERDTAVG